MEVERHNLNRQVIFTEADIGLPKIEATRRWLAQRLDNSKVNIVYELIDSMAHEIEACEDGADLDEFFDEPIDSDSEVADVLDASEVFEHLNKTDLVLGCLDAMRPRVLADLIAAQRGLPYSNGGIANYSGEFREFSTSSLVELYGASIAQDRKVSSCQEDGEVPQSSNGSHECTCWGLPSPISGTTSIKSIKLLSLNRSTGMPSRMNFISYIPMVDWIGQPKLGDWNEHFGLMRKGVTMNEITFPSILLKKEGLGRYYREESEKNANNLV